MKKIKVTIDNYDHPGDIFRNDTFFVKLTDSQWAQIELGMEITGCSLGQFINSALREGLLDG